MLFDLKRANRIRIFKAIRKQGNMSRRDISYELQLSRPTVDQNLTELAREGYVKEAGLAGSIRGRRATVYSVCGNARIAMGLNITKNHITIVCVNLTADNIYTKRIRYPFERSEGYLRKLSDMIEETIVHQKLDREKIVGVGIAAPGLILDGSKIYYGKSLNFTDMTQSEFADSIPFPCKLYNDADAAGYAEALIGTAEPDSFYISLNNNVGGAILINGSVYRGECSKSGEIGHITLERNGKPCFCGQKGCLDAYCNATVLSKHTDGDLKTFFEKVKAEDAKCANIWNTYLEYLAVGINDIRMLFDSQIIIGGYVGAYMEPYLPQLERLAIKLNPFETKSDYLKVCKVKGEASAVGAALPFIQHIVDNI